MKTLFLRSLVILCVMVTYSSWSQNGTQAVWNPFVQVNLKTDSPWSFSVGSAYRNTMAETIGEDADFESQHAQLSQTTNYAIGSNQKASLTLTYRFNKPFIDNKGNEFRITEKYSYTKKYSTIKVGHQIKVDQRLLADETIYRFRYRFQVVVPLRSLETDVKKLNAVVSTEALASYSALAAPEIDQRFTGGLEYYMTKKYKLTFDLEYRFEDYNHNSVDRFFVYTGLSYTL